MECSGRAIPGESGSEVERGRAVLVEGTCVNEVVGEIYAAEVNRIRASSFDTATPESIDLTASGMASPM